VKELEESRLVARFARWSGRVASSPYAPIITLLLIGLGLYVLPSLGVPLERASDVHLLVGVLTLLLVFLLEHNARRDTTAIHVKLDEVLVALRGAREDKVGVEELPAGDLEKVRERGRDHARTAGDGERSQPPSAHR
jgi:low affinity Fe/Cu permease